MRLRLVACSVSLCGAAACGLVIGIDDRRVEATTTGGGAGNQGTGAGVVSSATGSTSVGGSGGGCPPSQGGAPECEGTDAYSNLILADSPIAYWRLNDTVAGAASDASCSMDYAAGFASGAGGIPLELGADGVLGNDTAIRFAGFDHDHLTVGSLFNFPEGQSFSLEAWINPESQDGFDRRIFDKHVYADPPTTPRQGYFLAFDISAAKFERWIADVRETAASNTALDLNMWTHLVGTYDASGMEMCLYVNGRPFCSPTSVAGTTETAAEFRIGATSLGSTGPEGTLDELAIYDYALTHHQVFAHCNATNAVTCEAPADPCP